MTATLELTLETSGCNHANVARKPRLLSDNGSSLHLRRSGEMVGRPEYGPRPWRAIPSADPGQIERWHQTLKNRICSKIIIYQAISKTRSGPSSITITTTATTRTSTTSHPLTPTPGRHTAIIERRQKIKKLTIQNRRLNHHQQSRLTSNQDEPKPPLENRLNSPKCFDDGQWNGGGAADSYVMHHDVPAVFAGHYDPSFPIALCLKDLDLIDELMTETGTRNDLIKAAHACFRGSGRALRHRCR